MSTKSLFRPARRNLPVIGLAVLLAGTSLKWLLDDATVHAHPVPAAGAVAVARLDTTASYADLVSRVSPSVVTIRAQRVVRPAGHEPQLPDELRRFFGEGFGRGPAVPRRQGGLGSGVIVSADGYILTNHHVPDAPRIEVELDNRRTLTATRIGSDPASDLALLKVDGSGLTPLPFGDSRAVRVGDVALAFGNPLGVGQTVTSGIISAKGRATGTYGSFEDFLQTDAPINQGNSGGALVNTKGELIGINSQILSPSGGNIGIGFAIPSSMAQSVMEQLMNGGKVRRGQLGVQVQAVTSEIARSLGMKEVTGALVSAVTAESAAEEAGVQRGDVILALNGNRVTDGNSLRNEIASTRPGSNVTLTVRRGGGEKTLSVKLGELAPANDRASAEEAGETNGRLGLRVRPATREEAKELGTSARHALVVESVDEEGPAAEAGFRAGDVIQEVDGKPVTDANALRAAVKAAGDRPALVLVAREGGHLFLPLSGRG